MWKPRKNGDKVWYIDCFFKPHKARMFFADESSMKMIRRHNCFRTQKDAQDAIYAFQAYLLCKEKTFIKGAGK